MVVAQFLIQIDAGIDLITIDILNDIIHLKFGLIRSGVMQDPPHGNPTIDAKVLQHGILLLLRLIKQDPQLTWQPILKI